MKKIFTLFAAAVIGLSAAATDYKGTIAVTVNGSRSEQAGIIAVNQQGDLYTLSLEKFILQMGQDQVKVGNIIIDKLANTVYGTVNTLAYNGNIKIQNPNDGAADWIGPMLGDVPIDLKARFNGTTLYTHLDIQMSGMTIGVDFVTDGFQIPNSGFETWHQAGSQYEPNSWHSFGSATGSLASIPGERLVKSAIVRPGSPGLSSAQLTSTSIFGIVANGTMTTGRMAAAGFSASDPSNNASLDASKTDLDGNNDPFYIKLPGFRPDSLSVWVKFKQAVPNTAAPYATVSAAITDGTYYQEPAPAGTTYTNVMARAAYPTIESKDFAWQRLSVPFSYVDKSVEGNYLLATFSTNAQPGAGTANDTLYVDDIELVYDAGISAINFQGNAVEGWTENTDTVSLNTNVDNITTDMFTLATYGQGAIVNKSLTQGDNPIFTAAIFSQDLSKSRIYTIKVINSAGVDTINTKVDRQIRAIYDINGRQVSNTDARGIYIITYTDGTSAKFVK